MEAFASLDIEHGLCLPNHALFIGQTMSGKTSLLMELLQNPQCFNPPPGDIYLYYSQWQEGYESLEESLAAQGIRLHLRQGSQLTLDDIQAKETQSIYIIDDATEETASSDDIAKITTDARHKNASLYLLWHMLYTRHPASRTIASNTAYYFFLPSVRLTSQLKTLDTHLGYKGKLVEAYKMAIRDAGDFRYLFANLAPYCDERLRLKSQVHDTEHQFVFLT